MLPLGGDTMMLEWKKLPHGTLRAQDVGITYNVWPIGGGWRYTVDNGSEYLASGTAPTLEAACEAALWSLR